MENIEDIDVSEFKSLLDPAVVRAKFDISEDELRLLSEFGSSLDSDVKDFIEDFYVWMQKLAEYPQFFKNTGTVDRVKGEQIRYWNDFFKGDITNKYLRTRIHIGTVHARIGLPIHSYCSAMNFSMNWWTAKILEGKDEKLEQAARAQLVKIISKLIQLDVSLVTQTYHQQTQKKLQATLDETQKIVHDVTKVAQSVVEGDFTTTLKNDGKLNVAINKMIKSLNESAEKNRREAWVKTGHAQLSERLSGDIDIPTLCSNAIDFLTKYFEAQVGVFYIINSDNELELMGSYAYQHRKNLSNKFKVGESLIGQAVLEKKTIIIENVPADYMKVSSGLGEATVKSLMVFPIVVEGHIKGVIEIGKLKDFNELHLELSNVVNEMIGVSLEVAKNKERMNELYEDSQRKSKALEEQSAKLEATNADLKEKAAKIKASEEELKQQSEELQATNEELEEKTEALEAQKRDIEKKNRDLQESKRLIEEKAKELQRSGKYKSEFLSNMSHELRTPLNSLLILSQTLMENTDGNMSDEQVEQAGIINQSGKDLLNLINDILDLSKVEAGKLNIESESFVIEDLVDGLNTMLSPVAKNNQVNFSCQCSSSLPQTLISDPMRIEQILKNLLSNALKFTDKGGDVTLKVGKAESSQKFINSNLKPESTIFFAVRDTGIGIPDDEQDTIFKAFQQVDGSINRRYGGTGLGLTISRQLAELLGGEIQLQSKVGEGSTFTLFLPLEKGEDIAKPDDTMSALDDILQANAPTGATKREKPLVLLIEDDPNFKDILENSLQERSVDFLSCSLGEEGVNLAKKHLPTAIILDVGLPDVSGLSVLETLRSDKKTANIPVHIVSAADVRTSSIQKGAVGFINKPVDKEGLSKLLDNASTIIQEPIKEVLIVEDNEIERDAIIKSIDSDNIHISYASSAAEAEGILKQKRVHCMILDLHLPDASGKDFLQKISDNPNIVLPAIIVHTAQDITPEEEQELNAYAPSVVLKSADSQSRLSDEVNLFLHKITADESPVESNVFKSLPKVESKGTQDFKGRKILLVDDDMRNNIALGSYLRRHGLETITADNGELALSRLKENKDIDLVFMDIMMPVMDGYTTMQHIREDETNKELPIIALTAKAMSDDRKKCIESGANDYLTKPVDLDKLFSVMRVWLKDDK